MGRKKKSKHMHAAPKATSSLADMTYEEQEFRQTALNLGFVVPHQLSDWKRHFVSEKTFLRAANEWLEDKCNGMRFPRIEDDVDKGLMRKTPAFQSPPYRPPHNPMVPSATARKPWQEYEDQWDDEWYGQFYGFAHGAGTGLAGSGKGKWWQHRETLPAVPKIAAPNGLAFVDMATVF